MAAWISFTGVSHHNLLPQVPSVCLSAVNSSPRPGLTPQTPAPSRAVPSRGPSSVSRVCMAAARTVWFSFHLSCHRSAVSLSALNVSPPTQTTTLMCDRTPASVPPLTEGRSSSNTPVFPLSSFILPSFAWFYIFFSTGQVLLSTLNWCSACTSVSEGVFLMHP